MKKLFFGVGVAVLASTAGVSISAARYEDVVKPNTTVGPVVVGGLTPEEAARKLRVWWEGEKLLKIKLHNERIKKGLPELKPSELGVTFDDLATVEQLPLQDFAGNAQSLVTQEETPISNFNPIYKPNGQSTAKLAEQIRQLAGEPKPARISYVKGAIHRKPETTVFKLEEPKLYDAAVLAMERDRVLELPIVEAPKKVTDEGLAQVKEVVAEFTTRFSAGNRPRSSNIKLATEKINGVVLAPGESFSFNGTVGRRTARAGFREAGVYINGRHDTGIGGGICQVSTTLYNVALFSNLKIQKRTNHSLPVPYVPVGRDATVNWGAQDLVFQNNYDTPIAVAASYQPGKLSFWILGKKKPGLEVKVEQGARKSWAGGTRTVVDRSLPPGARRVVEAGSTGHSVSTYRLVYQNGQLVKREPLGRSYYAGGARIIAVGPPPRRMTPPPAATPVVPAANAMGEGE